MLMQVIYYSLQVETSSELNWDVYRGKGLRLIKGLGLRASPTWQQLCIGMLKIEAENLKPKVQNQAPNILTATPTLAVTAPTLEPKHCY